MKNIFKKGDRKEYEILVSESDVAAFESGVVHHVYSTFSLTRDAEWSGRLFVLDMKEDTEEGIGTSITVAHKSPAFVGSIVKFIATFDEITDKGEIINSYQAFVGDRLIAQGRQGQRILPKLKIETLFNRLKE